MKLQRRSVQRKLQRNEEATLPSLVHQPLKPTHARSGVQGVRSRQRMRQRHGAGRERACGDVSNCSQMRPNKVPNEPLCCNQIGRRTTASSHEQPRGSVTGQTTPHPHPTDGCSRSCDDKTSTKRSNTLSAEAAWGAHIKRRRWSVMGAVRDWPSQSRAHDVKPRRTSRDIIQP